MLHCKNSLRLEELRIQGWRELQWQQWLPRWIQSSAFCRLTEHLAAMKVERANRGAEEKAIPFYLIASRAAARQPVFTLCNNQQLQEE
jgi:hypothetical protein